MIELCVSFVVQNKNLWTWFTGWVEKKNYFLATILVVWADMIRLLFNPYDDLWLYNIKENGLLLLCIPKWLRRDQPSESFCTSSCGI